VQNRNYPHSQISVPVLHDLQLSDTPLSLPLDPTGTTILRTPVRLLWACLLVFSDLSPHPATLPIYCANNETWLVATYRPDVSASFLSHSFP